MRVRLSYIGCAALWLSYALCGLAQAESPVLLKPSVAQGRRSPRIENGTVNISPAKTNRSIYIVGDNFTIDGQPIQIISGSLHYFRVPAEYWSDRLHKLKAAGLNSVSTYVEWSFHEPEERQYSFEGDRDVAAFIRLAAEEGLHVLLRPGPYICAERDMGGFPYWLLAKYPGIQLRSTDADYMAETKLWFEKLFEQLGDLLFGNGGPIILVQVENEYGSYGYDMSYKTQMRDIMYKHVGEKALLFTVDGSVNNIIPNGAIPGVLTTINYGAPSTKNMKESFQKLRNYMAQGPLMNSEFYPGWMSHWGHPSSRIPIDIVMAGIEDMLNSYININIYVFFGGTNFGFTAGANYEDTYEPTTTSYDYDAPLNEAGDPTPKYYVIREALAKRNPRVRDIDPPLPSNKSAYGIISLNKRFHLLSQQGRTILGKKYPGVVGSTLPTYEQLRQRTGLMLYETTLGEKTQGTVLAIRGPRDRIHVYVDGRFHGTISWNKRVFTLLIETKLNSVISLLVENQGRINYGFGIHEFKGIHGSVIIDRRVVNGSWSVTGFPLQNLESVATAVTEDEQAIEGPIFFEGYFTIPENERPQDTFFDTSTWGKGYIWVNGHNLGRYWPSVGPQVTLYVPGCWLRARNHVQLLELDQAPATTTIRSIKYPILDRHPPLYL